MNCDRGIGFGLGDRGIGFGLGDRGHVRGIVRNNVLYHDSTAGFADVAIGLKSAPGGQVYNNTVIHQNPYPNAIECRFPGTSGVLIANNLSNRAIQMRNESTGEVNHNLTTADPAWFVAPSAGDAHLRMAVPAVVDQGRLVNGLDRDIDGDVRPQGDGIDLGADEMLDTSSTPVPSGLTPIALGLLLAVLALLAGSGRSRGQTASQPWGAPRRAS